MYEMIKVEKPVIPKDWNYGESVKKVKQIIYKWKNLTTELIYELWIAREKLRSQGKRKDLEPHDKSREVKDWGIYCKEIGSQRDVVNRWLNKWFNPERMLKILNEFKYVTPYDQNMYHLSSEIEGNFDDDVLCIDPIHGENDIRQYKEYYPTITRLSILYHPDGREFTLREYARIQDFPDSFKFVGTTQKIKDQIGEAVSPKMGEHIIKKYIKGTTYIELFCGCGGFSLGAHNLGKKCLWSNDFNRYATHSFKLNFPDVNIRIQDIKKLNEKKIYEKIGKVDFIIGGPPCQGFSKAGKRLGFKEDKRNSLYLDFIRFLKCFKPKQFIMENVKEILKYQDEIKKDFEKIGYNVIVDTVNGLDIGMKQKRIRVFFIGNYISNDNIPTKKVDEEGNVK